MIEKINKIKLDMKADIESQAYSLQSIFNKYLDDIETLKSEGIQYQFIHKSLSLGITLPHFHNLLFRAKKNRSLNEASNERSFPDTYHKEQAPNKRSNTPAIAKSVSEIQEIDLVEWKMIMPDIAEKLVHDIVNQGYKIEEVKLWIEEKRLPNSSALRRYFTALKQTTY